MANGIDPQTGLPTEDNLDFSQMVNPPRKARAFTNVNAIPAGQDIQLGSGVGSYRRDANLDFMRAQQFPQELEAQRADLQTGWELAGKALGQGLTEATLGALEGIGYALDFEEIFNADKQAEEGFDNAFSKIVREAKESIQENVFPIYQSQTAQNGTLGQKLGDATWWAGQGKTAGTTLSLMIPSIGVGKAVATLGKLGRVASPLAAAAFSRKAESAMEANQKFQEAYEYHYNDPKLIEELASGRQKEMDQISTELNNLYSTLYSPEQENYELLQADRNSRIAELENMRGQITNELTIALEEEARMRAGNEAANVFKANAAMLPLDMVQYALLMKPFSQIKAGIDAAKNATVGKIAGHAIVQPASEALEEGYQFVAGEEASAAQRQDADMFGEGFSKRLSKYAKDPHLHEAMFLGGAMGILFDVAGTAVQKKMERINKLAHQAQDPNNTPEKVENLVKTITTDQLIDDYKDGKINRTIEELNAFKEEMQNNERFSDEDKAKNAELIDASLANADFILAEHNELEKDDRFKDPVLRSEYVKIKAYDKIYADEVDKMNNLVESQLNESGIEPSLTGLLEDKIDKQQLKAARNELFKEYNFTQEEKDAINGFVDDRVEELNNRIKETSDSIKKETGKSPKLTPRNIERINTYSKERAKANIYREAVVKNKLDSFANISKENAVVESEKLKSPETQRIQDVYINRIKQAETTQELSDIKSTLQTKYPEIHANLERNINGKIANIANKEKVNEVRDRQNQTVDRLNNEISRVRTKEDASKVRSMINKANPETNVKKQLLAALDTQLKKEARPVGETVVPKVGRMKGKEGNVIKTTPSGKKTVEFDDGSKITYKPGDLTTSEQVTGAPTLETAPPAPGELPDEMFAQFDVLDIDVEAKKADIEKRRQEELSTSSQIKTSIREYSVKDLADNSIKTVKIITHADGSVIREMYIDGETFSKDRITDSNVINNLNILLELTGLIKKQGEIKPSIQKIAEIVGEKELSLPKSKAAEKINAKYDAELAALEESDPFGNPNIPDFGDIDPFDGAKIPDANIDVPLPIGATPLSKSDKEVLELNKQPEIDAGIPVLTPDVAKDIDNADREVNGENRVRNFMSNQNVTLAMKAKEDVRLKGGGFSDKYDQDGKVIPTENYDAALANPENFKEGSRVILSVDNERVPLVKGKMTAENIPISVQTEEDYYSGKKPYISIRDLTNPRYAKMNTNGRMRTFEIRKKFFDAYQKDNDVRMFSKVLSKDSGWTNRSKEFKTLRENLYINDNLKYGPIQIASTDRSRMVTLLDGTEVLSASKELQRPGIPNLIINNAVGDKIAIPLRFKEIRENPNMNEYVDNVFMILENYMKEAEGFKDIDIYEEVGKYFHLKKTIENNIESYSPMSGKGMNNIFGLVRLENTFRLYLPNTKGFKLFEINKVGDNLEIKEYIGKKDTKPVSRDELYSQFNRRLESMYPNVLDKYGQDPESFDRFMINDQGQLVRSDKQNYFDFLSDKQVVTTKVHPLLGSDGQPYYVTQPNIEIDENIVSQIDEPIKQVDEAEISEARPDTDRYVLKDVDFDDAGEAIPTFEEEEVDLFDDVDDEDSFELEDTQSADLKIDNAIDYNNTSLSSFKNLDSIEEENKLLHSVLIMLLKKLDMDRLAGREVHVPSAIKYVFDNITSKESKFRAFSTKPISKEVAKANKVYSSHAKNKIVADYLKMLSDNFDQSYNEDGSIKFIGYGNKLLTMYNALSFNSIHEMEEDIIDEGNNERTRQIDGIAYKTDPEKSMSAQIKRLLASIPVINSNGKRVANKIGQPEYENYGKVFNYLLESLANVAPEDIVSELNDLAAENFMAKGVKDRLNDVRDNNPDIYNKFISVMKKQKADFLSISFEKRDKGVTAKVVEANKSNAAGVIFDGWNSDYRTNGEKSGLLKNVEGTIKIDKDEAKKLLNEFAKRVNKLDSLDELNAVISTLNKVGIDVSPEAIEKLKKDFDNKQHKKYFKAMFGDVANRNTFERFFNSAFIHIFNDLAAGKNPYETQTGTIKKLATYQQKFEPEASSASFRNAAGDIIYSYVNPHHLSNTIEYLKSNEDFRQTYLLDEFSKNSTWLQDPSQISLAYYDASRNSRKGSIAKQFQEQNDIEKEITKLNLYVNRGHVDTSYFFTPSPSDKTTFALIKAKRMPVPKGSFENGILNLNDELVDKLYNLLAVPEINRINKTIRDLNEFKAEGRMNDLINGYHYHGSNVGAGGYFFMIPELNEALERDEDGSIITNEANIRRAKEVIVSYFETQANKKLAYWRENEVLDNIDTKSREIPSRETAANLAAEYVINSAVSYANQYMLFTGDPAQFAKLKGFDGKFENWAKVLEGTIPNMFKRIAKDIAPGIEGNFGTTEADRQYKMAFINEPVKSSQLGGAYKDIDLADAQEWTTLEEHVKVMYAYGKIDADQRDAILTNRDNLTYAQIATVLQPLKPVQVLADLSSDFGTMTNYYVKTSSFPLIPQLTKGFPQLEKMRKFMEDNGVDRLAPKSAVKLGFHKATNLFEDGNFIDNNDFSPSNIITMDRRGFRLQQDIPYDPKKMSILEGSQLRKLIHGDIPYNHVFMMDGKPFTGKELKGLNDRIHEELFSRKFSELTRTLNADEDLVIQDVSELRSLIVREAADRGYGINEILALNTMKLDNGRVTFELPLFFHPMSHKIESLLTSVVKNRVLKSKLPGKSYVQGSSLGFQVATKEFLDAIAGTDNGVILTDNFKGDLDYREDEDGLYGEVFVPSYFKYKDNTGATKSVDMTQYIKGNGTLDTSRIDPELLTLIGYRIPTQGYSSMIRLKVAGILPSVSGDLIVVPPAMARQMGSDFDVDKLYVHRYNFKEVDGNLVKDDRTGDVENLSEEQLQNKLIDIFHTVLRDKRVGQLAKQPLDNDEISNLVDGPLSIEKAGLESVISDDLHTAMIDVQSAGKIGIGITSVASTFHALSQYAGLYIAPKDGKFFAVKFSNTEANPKEYSDHDSVKEIKVGERTLYNPKTNTVDNNIQYGIHSFEGAWRLDKIFGFTGRKVSDVITNIQTESVDNANNGRLFPMNLNKNTFNVAMLIARSGHDEKMIGYFLNQPIVKEYVRRLNSMNNFTDVEFVKNKKEQLKFDLLNQIGDSTPMDELNVENISLEEMSKAIGTQEINTDLQRKVLKNFYVYEEIADGLRSVQSALNVDTQYLGANFSGVVDRRNKFFYKMSTQVVGNSWNLAAKTTAGAAVKYGVMRTVELFGQRNLLPYDSSGMLRAFGSISEAIGTDLTEYDIENISIGIRSSLWNEVMNNVFPEIDIKSKRSELLFGDNTLAKRVVEAKAKMSNNIFIQSLNPIEAFDKNEPSVVEHYSAKDAKAEYDFRKQQGWLELLQAPKGSYEHALGMDLFIYSTTFGTERTARDFGRFLPYDFIATSGLAKELRSVDFSDGIYTDKLESNFVEQYFQHNPNRLPEISVQDIQERTLGSIATPKPEFAEKQLPYVKFFSKATKATNVYKLMGDGTYVKLDRLGSGTFITEYSLSDEFATTVMPNNPKGVKVVDKVSINNDAELIEEVESGNEILEKQKFYEGLKPALEAVVKSGSSYADLARYFLDNIDKIDEYQLQAYDAENPIHRTPNEDRYVRGRIARRPSGERLILIAPDHIDNVLRYQRTLMHELSHAFTLSVWNTPNNELTQEQRVAKEKVEELFNDVHEKVSDEIKIDPRYKNGFSTVGEFVAEALSNKDFQDLLNKTRVEGGTVWNKFKELISRFFNGIVPKSALEKVMHSVMNVIETNKGVFGQTDSMNEPIVRMYQKFKNRPVFRPKQQAPGASKVVLEENGVSFYTDDYPKGSNKRAIANRFFRYRRKNGSVTEPYYPFMLDRGSWQINKEYIDYINSHYNQGVVGVENDGSIVFRPNVENAKLKNSKETWVQKEIEFESADQPLEIEETTAIDKAIISISNRLALLQRRVAKTGGTPGMRANINALQSQIDKLEEEKEAKVTPDILQQLADADANVIESNLLTVEENVDNVENLSPEQILNLMDTLVNNSYNIQGWIDIQDYVEHENIDLQNKLDEVTVRYKKLNKKYNQLTADLFTEYANRFLGKDFAKNDIVEAVKDMSFWSSQTSTIGESGIPLLELVDDIIKDAADDINNESIQNKAEVADWVNKLEEVGYSMDQVNDLFKQVHKGKWTGNIVGEISHDYYVTKDEMFKKAKADNKWSEYSEWLRNNSNSLGHEDLRSISEGDFTSAESMGYSTEEVNHQKDLLQQYEDEKDAYREIMEMKYSDENLIAEEMNAWERSNSPYLNAQGEQNNGSRYIIREKAKVELWADSKFDRIKENETLYNFYKFMKQRFDENNKTVGYFNQFDEFYLPEREASLLERIKTQPGLKKKAGFLINSLKEEMSDEVEGINTEINIEGKAVKSVPIYMMANKIAPQMKEGNIFKILDEHTDMALNYKYKTQIEPMVNASSDLLENMKEIQVVTEEGIQTPKKKFGFTIKRAGQLVNAKEALQYAKDAFLYNSKKQTGERLWKTSTKEFVEVEGELKEERVVRDITTKGLTDTLIGYTYLRAMSFPNIVTPAVNMMFGINSNLIYASAGQDVDLKNIRKAMLQMSTITARSFGGLRNPELVEKTFAFMERFQLLGTIHDSSYGSKKSVSEMMTILQSKAEHFNQGSLMLGMLYTQKLKDKNDNDVDLFSAYNVENGKLVWNTELMGEQAEVGPDRIISEDKRGVNLKRLGRHIDKVNATVHGDYKSSMLAKKTSVGRLLMLFKTWLPKALDHRFGSERFDKDLMDIDGSLGRTVKGRYRSFVRPKTKDGHVVLFKETIGMLVKGMVSKKAFDQLDDVDRVNLIRNMKEIRQIMMIYGAVAMLQLAFGDDDEDIQFALNLAINTLTKAQSDLSFFISPNSASQVLENIAPVVTTLKDAERAIGSIYDLFQGEVVYESGPWRGQPKTAVSAMRMVPGFTGGIKMVNLGSKIIEY